MAFEALLDISDDPDERARYLARDMAYRDAEHDKAVMAKQKREWETAKKEKKAALAEKKAAVKEKETAVKEKETAIKEKEKLAAALAEKDAEIAKLRELLTEQ